MSTSTRPLMIKNLTLSPVNNFKDKDNNEQIINLDNNLIRNKHLPSKEISELMKGSYTNRNKLNIFSSPRNQIIKHFKDSLSKTSEDNYLSKSKPLNKLGKNRSSNKFVSSNKYEDKNSNLNEINILSLANTQNFYHNPKKYEIEKINKLEKNLSIYNTKIDKDLNLRVHKKQNHLSLDRFLTNNSLNPNKNNHEPQHNLNHISEKVINTDFDFFNSPEKLDIDNKNKFEENNHNYNIDELIEKENNNFIMEKNNFNISNTNKPIIISIQNNTNIKLQESKEYNSEHGKIDIVTSKICEKTKKISNKNSLDANIQINKKERISFLTNKKIRKNNSSLMSNYYTNFNTNLLVKKNATFNKNADISNNIQKKKISISKDINYGNSKNIISEKIVKIDKNINDKYFETNNNNHNFNGIKNQKETNIKETDKIIMSERFSIKKKTVMDKNLSSRKFYNEKKIVSNGNSNLFNKKSNRGNKTSDYLKKDIGAHFNSISIANIISPQKNINLSQNNDSIISEKDIYKTENNKLSKIKTEKSFISVSQDFTNTNNKNNNLFKINSIEKIELKNSNDSKSKKKIQKYDHICFKSEINKNSVNSLNKNREQLKKINNNIVKKELSNLNKSDENILLLKARDSRNSFNENGLNKNIKNYEDNRSNRNFLKDDNDYYNNKDKLYINDFMSFNSEIKFKDGENEDIYGSMKSDKFEKILNNHQSPNIQKNINQEINCDFNLINNINQINCQSYLNKNQNSANFICLENGITQENLKKSNNLIFEKDKSNLINLNTYSLLKKQKEKNNLINKDFMMQDDSEKQLDKSSDSKTINRNKTNELKENNFNINSKESALQSNIDLYIDVDEINSNNSLTKAKNPIFIKTSCINNQIDIGTNNFFSINNKINQAYNKDFTNLEEKTNISFNSNFEKPNDLSDNSPSKNLQNLETQIITKGEKPKKIDIFDNLIPSPIPRKKEKPIFMEIINDLKINSEKFSPLRRIKESEKQSILNKNITNNLQKNNLFNNEVSENNVNLLMSRNKSIEEREIIKSNSKNQRSNKKSICESNKIKKINKFDLDNMRENSPSNIKSGVLEINKISAKELTGENFIKNINFENVCVLGNSDIEKNLNNSRMNYSINENLTSNLTSNFNNVENLDFLDTATKIKNAQNIQENSKHNLFFDMKSIKIDMLNMPFKKDILETNNNNENIDNIKIKEEYSTINNINDEVINTSKYKSNSTENREYEITRINKYDKPNVNENENYVKEKINYQTENFSFKKINYHIDPSNNYRNKNNDRNILINKHVVDNLTSSKKIYNNNSENGNNFNLNVNREKNSTLSTLFNENEVVTNTNNKNNLINHKNNPYQNGRKNKNSLNNFAEYHKNKFNNLTDISNKINFTVSSIITENANIEDNQENKSKDDNFKNNEEENPYINESEKTHIKEFSNNINYHILRVSRQIKNEENETISSQGSNSNLDLNDLDDKMINYEIPFSNESNIIKKTNFLFNNLKHEKVIEASKEKVIKKAFNNKNEKILSKNYNHRRNIKINEFKNHKKSTSPKTEIKNIINDEILTINDSAEEYTINNNENCTFNKINNFEIKNRIRKSDISGEKNVNSCNNLSIKNTNFAKNKNEDCKNNQIHNILGNLIINKKLSTVAFSEHINSIKNPLEYIINKNNKNIKQLLNENDKKSKLIKEDYVLTEINTDETARINNLKAYVGKNIYNEKITQNVSFNNSNDCRDLDESASLINYNYNLNNIDMNNSNMISFYESGRRSKLQGHFEKKLKFDLVLKIHDFSNTNLIKLKSVNQNNYFHSEKNTKSEIYKNDVFNKKNLQYDNNQHDLINDYDISQNSFLNINNNNLSGDKEKIELNYSFSKDNHHYKIPYSDNNNNQNDSDKLTRKNDIFLSEFYTDLHMKEINEFKENLKIINNNIIRFNTDKSQSSKKTSNNPESNYSNFKKNNSSAKGKKKFLSNSFWNILSFFNGYEIRNLYYSFRRMRLLIIDCLMIEVSRKILNKFKLNCGTFLELLSKKLTFKKNKSKIFLNFQNYLLISVLSKYFFNFLKFNFLEGNFIIDLLISSRILNKDIYENKTNFTANLIFTYKQLGSNIKNYYNNIYKFDVNLSEHSNQKIWISREFRNVS